MSKKILFIFGTRPEAIKMAPLIKAIQQRSDKFETKICITGQHREMLDQVLDFFQITADADLNLMQANQTLFDITSRGLLKLQEVLAAVEPELIFVQGDTTTAFIGSLAGYYTKTNVAHLEAGLRSHNKYSPFPEEINRILTGHIAEFHFAPTPQAVLNLKNEGITKNVWSVGNTVIDALFLGLDIIKKTGDGKYRQYFNFINFTRRLILVTGHRRESFGQPFENICQALLELVESYTDIEIIYPVHLNPNVQEPVYRILKNHSRIHLIEPLDYPYLLWLMNQVYFVLTDSGGIQEEAPSLGKPVLVMRDVTERTEGIEAGNAKLVGTNRQVIVTEAKKLLDDLKEFNKMTKTENPYGDGKTSIKIAEILSYNL